MKKSKLPFASSSHKVHGTQKQRAHTDSAWNEVRQVSSESARHTSCTNAPRLHLQEATACVVHLAVSQMDGMREPSQMTLCDSSRMWLPPFNIRGGVCRGKLGKKSLEEAEGLSAKPPRNQHCELVGQGCVLQGADVLLQGGSARLWH